MSEADIDAAMADATSDEAAETIGETELPYLNGQPVECWHCHHLTVYGQYSCDRCNAAVSDPPELAVTEASQGVVTLHSLYVGSEYNCRNPVMLDGDQIRRLRAELDAALAQAEVTE